MRNERLDDIQVRPQHHLAACVDVLFEEIRLHKRRAKFVFFAAVHDDVDGFRDLVRIREADEFLIPFHRAFDVHGDIIKVRHAFPQHVRIGAVGIQFDEKAALLDEFQRLRQLRMDGRLAARDRDGVRPLPFEAFEEFVQLVEIVCSGGGVAMFRFVVEQRRVMAEAAMEIAAAREHEAGQTARIIDHGRLRHDAVDDGFHIFPMQSTRKRLGGNSVQAVFKTILNFSLPRT